MLTRSALLFENGLPDLPALLIEPHRNPGGIWRIKFSYETSRTAFDERGAGIGDGGKAS